MHLVPTICNLLHSYVSFSGYFDICRGISVLDLWGSDWNLIVNKVQSFVYVDNKRFAIFTNVAQLTATLSQLHVSFPTWPHRVAN